MDKKSEKRRAKRLDCKVPVDAKQGTAFATTQTIDISRGGLGFLSQKPIVANQRIAVQLELSPDEDPIVVSGRVQWVQKLLRSKLFRFGIKFEQVVDGSKNRLTKFLKA
ncbi:MAG: hypothetical protein A2787_03950 [Omnitrophica WOR_2 bacterium RIFCSPHIGHO2_01_FULL_48_9]|nr:MAG: hypothetical protein A3D10_04395 [Omnitrophica WOR_2 bacterium RIFCSPHIGHO2_02_FULL_48_11]OGX29909.1 MAG: hypothetical protein A2787_03950 [Omnitrophica WOR_2 bacterium RIFCSPHIGHO2_01_FULL_48_9]